MEKLYWLILVFWIIGAISEIAKINRKIYENSIQEPYPGLFIGVRLMLFFTWPYWYFYGKE